MNSPSSRKNPYLNKDTAGKGIVPSPAKQPTKTEKAKASVKVPTRKTVTEKEPVSPKKKLIPTDG